MDNKDLLKECMNGKFFYFAQIIEQGGNDGSISNDMYNADAIAMLKMGIEALDKKERGKCRKKLPGFTAFEKAVEAAEKAGLEFPDDEDVLFKPTYTETSTSLKRKAHDM